MSFSFAILRTKKLKTFGNIAGSLSHNYRTRDTPNADVSRTHDNRHTRKTAQQAESAIRARIPEKRRKDAVLCVEYLITASPDWSGWTDDRKENYFREALDWLKERHGAENVCAVTIHEDESTPHLVAYVVPIKDNKLNCKHFLGGREKLRDMQTSFANRVSRFDLSRGVEGSRAHHTTIKQYYADINNRTPVKLHMPSAEEITLPDKKLFEPVKSYAQNVASVTINAIADTVTQKIARLHKEIDRLKQSNADMKRTVDAVQIVARPYLRAIDGLRTDEVQAIVATIDNTRKTIDSDRAHEQQAKEQAKEQARAERAARREQQRADTLRRNGADLLASKRAGASYSGRVLSINHETGHIVQQTRLGKVLHTLKNTSIEAGRSYTISYDGQNRAKIAPEHDLSRFKGSHARVVAKDR